MMTILTPALIALQALEENFTLAVIVFVTGFIATLATLIFIVRMHRYWERHRPSDEEED
jgi:hypothetical protein